MSPREELARTMRRIYDLGLTTTSGGNLSLRDDAGRIWITPAGPDKGTLRASEIACVDGSQDAGQAPRASSELPFHRAVYEARSDLQAIVHAHPVSLVAFSITGQVPDTRVSADAHALCGTVGFAAYARPGSLELGVRIAEAFSRGFACVVLENHGVVVGGATLREAFERLETLDLIARTVLRARTLGQERLLSKHELALARPGVGPAATTRETQPVENGGDGSGAEESLREALCRLTRRACTRRLMTSTQGALSARLSTDHFLLTPRGRPLDSLEPSQLRRLTIPRGGGGEQEPDQALHAALYAAHDEVGAIAHGLAENVAGFSTAGAPLPSRTIPESYILLREPVCVGYRASRVEPDSIPALLGPENPVALVDNDGAITLGVDVLEAFDRLEVLEATAAAVIASRPLGRLTVMNDARIRELREAFFPGPDSA